MVLLELFWAFARVGLLGFGGGPSMIPLIQEEVVEVHHWLTAEEFLDGFAFGNSLPGPIATKMAAYTGYRVAGWLGAAVATTGIILPSAVAMLLLATLYLRYKDAPYVERFLTGVRPVVVALLFLVVYEFAPKAFASPAGSGQTVVLVALALGAFVLTAFYNIHPGWLILAGGMIGLVMR